MKRVLIVLLGALVLGVFLAGPAAAHDRLIKSTPKKNGKLDELSEIELTFSANVKLPHLLITAAGGGRQDVGKARTEDTKVIAPVEGALEPGKYVLAYRVVSSDGHPITGEIPFTLTGDPAEDDTTPQPAATAAPTVTPTQAQPEETTSAKVGPWIWGAAGLLGGVGIGLAIVLRKNKGAP